MRRNFIHRKEVREVNLAALPFQFPMRNAMTREAELRQMATCLAQQYAPLQLQNLRSETLSVVGYGPTLKDTWHLIEHPAITTSGAHDFLIARGFIPDWHTQCDGRDHQIEFLRHPHPDVEYLMASVCHPSIWEQLRGKKVRYWHQALGEHAIEWVGRNDPERGIVIAGGSNIGLAAIHVGGVLGFRKFRLYGMDGHWEGASRHSGSHPDPTPQKRVPRRAGGRTWETSPQMSNACDELRWLIRDHPDVTITVVGESLQAAVLRDWQATWPFWKQTLRYADGQFLANLVTMTARAELRALHAQQPTGSITPEAAIALHALCRRYTPKVVVEVGTYIGTSTLSLQASDMLYTCDSRNDCFPAGPRITTHPFQSGTTMLAKLVKQGVKVDLFFFDGRLLPTDVPLILRLANEQVILVFDDVVGDEKGVQNIRLLRPWFEDYLQIDAPPNTTLGVLIQRELI